LKATGLDRAEAVHHQYLPPVDGLRAVAIIAVVGFHVGLAGFSGGYVGVDVFFVISGFLIINQIRQDLENGRFSILSFYARRTLRILPPYLLMLGAVSLAAPFFLTTPTVYLDFLGSAVASPLMVSNVFFYLRAGYFDIEASQKPLLHTWTLAVEEQFYVAAPILLLLVFHLGRRRFGGRAAGVTAALAAASLAGAIAYTTTSGRNPAFYLAHWRAWEFIAGGVIGPSMVAAVARLPRPTAELLGLAGLAAIVLAIGGLNASLPYPSYWALLPVAGTAVAILACCAQPVTVAARLLAHPVMVAIGLVSYGWYLWHWPILSFMRILRLGDEALLPDLIGGGLVAFALACLSYRYVERPIRRWRRTGGIKRPSRIFAAGVAATLATATVCGLAALGGWRLTERFVAARYGVEGKGILDNGCSLTTTSNLPAPCLQGKVGILLGDSHAGALVGSFTRSADERGIRLVSLTRGGCDPLWFGVLESKLHRSHVCANLQPAFAQALARAEPILFAIIASVWWPHTETEPPLISELISRFDPTRTRVLLIGPVPEFKRDGLDCIALGDRYGQGRERCVISRKEAARPSTVEALKSAAARFPNVRFIDPMSLFCDDATCRPFSGDRVFYRDRGHVLPSGADRILDGFAGDFRWLAHER